MCVYAQQAQRDYDVKDAELLGFSRGALIELLDKNFATGWFVGRCFGRTGNFPAEYVQVDDADAPPSTAEMTRYNIFPGIFKGVN